MQQIAAQVPRLSEAGDRVLMFAHNFAQKKALEVSEGEYAQAASVIRAPWRGGIKSKFATSIAKSAGFRRLPAA